MAFLERVAQLQAPTFTEVVGAAAAEVPRREWAGAWSDLERGRTILEDEVSLNKYLIAYGLMHRAKLLHMLDDMRGAFRKPSGRMSIVDWGCGQGLASAVFIDWLCRNLPVKKIVSIRLVEVSNSARRRAVRILKRYSEVYENVEADVGEIRWVRDEPITFGKLDLPAGVPVVHLYSNILDLEAVDRQMLADLFEQSRQMAGVLALCVSPKCPGAEHIYDFFRLVGGDEMVACDVGEINFENPYSRKCSCTYNGCGFVMPALRVAPAQEPIVQPIMVHPAAMPPVEVPATPEPVRPPTPAAPLRPVQRRVVRRRGDRGRTYAFGFASTPFRDAMRSRPGWWTFNLALTRNGIPCDGGIAGLNPFLAVLNNIIVRGVPPSRRSRSRKPSLKLST